MNKGSGFTRDSFKVLFFQSGSDLPNFSKLFSFAHFIQSFHRRLVLTFPKLFRAGSGGAAENVVFLIGRSGNLNRKTDNTAKVFYVQIDILDAARRNGPHAPSRLVNDDHLFFGWFKCNCKTLSSAHSPLRRNFFFDEWQPQGLPFNSL